MQENADVAVEQLTSNQRVCSAVFIIAYIDRNNCIFLCVVFSLCSKKKKTKKERE